MKNGVYSVATPDKINTCFSAGREISNFSDRKRKLPQINRLDKDGEKLRKLQCVKIPNSISDKVVSCDPLTHDVIVVLAADNCHLRNLIASFGF